MINPKLLEKFSINLSTNSILEWWSDYSREFYTLDYLKFHLDQINEDYFSDRISEEKRDLLTALFIFENIVTPLHKVEDLENSTLFLEKYCKDPKNENFIKLHKLVSHSIPFGLIDIISISERYKSNIHRGNSEELKKWESGYLREYYNENIIKSRITFYQDLADELPENTEAILEVIDWLKDIKS